MTERENNTESNWKRALERRQTGTLSSNFSHQMMERIHAEAVKQQKRKERITWVALITSVLSVLALGVYFLCFYLDIRYADFLPSIEFQQDAFLFKFYGTIAMLALTLLGLDYWLRKKYI